MQATPLSQPPLPKKLPTHTRITLSNGYRAYHPTTPKPTTRGTTKPTAQKTENKEKPKKSVRFLQGHLTIPYHPSNPPSHTTKGVAPATPLPSGLQSRPGAVVKTGEEGDLGRFVRRAGAGRGDGVVWRKERRWRGSGRVWVLDEPVRDGLGCVREEVDLFGDGGDRDVGEEGEGGRLELKVREEGGYTVRVVKAKRRGGGGKKRARKVEREEEEEATWEVDGGNSLDGSGTLSETVSESESSDEGESLYDFSREEAEGWVPVMVADDDVGDDWMSLTGSWVLFGTAEAKR